MNKKNMKNLKHMKQKGPKKSVLITGIAGNLGRHLLAHLQREENFTLIGTDRRDGAHYRVDLLHKDMERVFQSHSLDTVIHLDLIHNPREDWMKRNAYNLSGTAQVINLCVQYGVKKFIFLSSANLYGPSPLNSQLLKEETPLLASAQTEGPDDLVKTDLLVQSYFWKNPGMEIVILRPCHIVGPLANGIIHYLRSSPLFTLMGYNPMIQLIHLDDLLAAFTLCLRHPLRGVFNVKGPGEISLHRFLKALGKDSWPLPSFIARGLLSSLSHFPPYELGHLKYPCMVDDSLFREKVPYRPRIGLGDLIEWVRKNIIQL